MAPQKRDTARSKTTSDDSSLANQGPSSIDSVPSTTSDSDPNATSDSDSNDSDSNDNDNDSDDTTTTTTTVPATTSSVKTKSAPSSATKTNVGHTQTTASTTSSDTTTRATGSASSTDSSTITSSMTTTTSSSSSATTASSTTSTLPSATQTAVADASSSHVNKGAIAGGVVAAVVVIAGLIILSFWWHLRRSRAARQQDFSRKSMSLPSAQTPEKGHNREGSGQQMLMVKDQSEDVLDPSRNSYQPYRTSFSPGTSSPEIAFNRLSWLVHAPANPANRDSEAISFDWRARGLDEISYSPLDAPVHHELPVQHPDAAVTSGDRSTLRNQWLSQHPEPAEGDDGVVSKASSRSTRKDLSVRSTGKASDASNSSRGMDYLVSPLVTERAHLGVGGAGQRDSWSRGDETAMAVSPLRVSGLRERDLP